MGRCLLPKRGKLEFFKMRFKIYPYICFQHKCPCFHLKKSFNLELMASILAWSTSKQQSQSYTRKNTSKGVKDYSVFFTIYISLGASTCIDKIISKIMLWTKTTIDHFHEAYNLEKEPNNTKQVQFKKHWRFVF